MKPASGPGTKVCAPNKGESVAVARDGYGPRGARPRLRPPTHGSRGPTALSARALHHDYKGYAPAKHEFASRRVQTEVRLAKVIFECGRGVADSYALPRLLLQRIEIIE